MKNDYIPLELIKIFPKEIRLKVRILTTIFQASSSVQIGLLVKNTSLDRKTIYKYIKEINEISIKHFREETIILDKKKQYYFGMSKSDFLTLRLLIFETTFTIELIYSFLKTSTVNITIFCLENFLSENTLKQQLRRINSLVKNFDIELKTRKGILYINGDEHKIRYFIAAFFWRTYRGFKWPFVNLEKVKLKKTLSFFYSNNYSNIKEVSLYLLAVNILRAKSKSFILEKKLPPYTNYLYDNNSNKIRESIVTNYHLPTHEIEFIILCLHIFPEYLLSNKNNTYILKQLSLYKKDSYLSILNFLHFVLEKHKNWPINSPKGQKFLSILITARIFVDIFNDTYFNIYELSLIYHSQREFPNLLSSIENSIKKYSPHISKMELKSLTFKYAQAYISTFPPQDFEPLIKILLITDIPIYIETILINRIKSVLSEQFNILILTSNQSDDFDFIIATGYVEESLLENKILFVYPHLPIKDLNNLINECLDVVNKKLKNFDKL
ncbi:helix-turn-helix domain-containing protein [Lactococcus lactis]|uniref:helix-turn-helix domain-containing protein n=1 Tax=Lactococcus lactis TaxID=1358 RepID=UPI0024175D2A|nr:helix-turn-helix domain-containing protein [Lactococcus lactis]MDG4959788.1 helix-turn-helix domain-containing protein [Lactococcus lactis]